MQQHHSKPEIEISSISLKRRDMLTGAAAIVAIGAAPAAAGQRDSYDALLWMIDEYREILQRADIAINEFDMLHMDPERPGPPQVLLSDLLGEEHVDRYYRHQPLTVFKGKSALDHVHAFFDEQIGLAAARARTIPECADWATVKAQDCGRVIAEMHRQTLDDQRWCEASGYNTASANVERLQHRLNELGTRIIEMPCRSLRDVAIKIDFVDEIRSYGFSVDQESLGRLLASIRDFANCCPSAATGQHVPIRARA